MRESGTMALMLAGASIAVGVAYFAYLNVVDFPPAIVRAVPFAWLMAAVAGIGLGIAAIRARRQVPLSVAGILLGLPSVAFAAIFALAAAMGD